MLYFIFIAKIHYFPKLMTEDYMQNIYRYSRKTYKKGRKGEEPMTPRQEPSNLEVEETSCALPDRENMGCGSDSDPELKIASILHMKCPVITLAQHQLQKLLDGTDRLICDNRRCCRSLYDLYCLCKEVLTSCNKSQYALLVLIGIAFVLGTFFGAASCGSLYGRFDSPILSCIDNYFIPDAFPTVQDSFRSVF